MKIYINNDKYAQARTYTRARATKERKYIKVSEWSSKKEYELNQKREQLVVKSNDLIQKSRFDLSILEQKIVLNLIQLIKPTDTAFQTYEFSVQDFCKLCNIDYKNGGNYIMIKDTIRKLSDKSFWIKQGKTQSLCRWINKARIQEDSGIIEIRLDDDLLPYLIELKNNYTMYSLINVLGMQSKYSPRIYELAKSNEYKKNFIINLQELKEMISAEHYINYTDFKRYVLDTAIKEINAVTDINLTYEPIKEGRKVTKIEFTTEKKLPLERYLAHTKAINKTDKRQNKQ